MCALVKDRCAPMCCSCCRQRKNSCKLHMQFRLIQITNSCCCCCHMFTLMRPCGNCMLRHETSYRTCASAMAFQKFCGPSVLVQSSCWSVDQPKRGQSLVALLVLCASSWNKVIVDKLTPKLLCVTTASLFLASQLFLTMYHYLS